MTRFARRLWLVFVLVAVASVAASAAEKFSANSALSLITADEARQHVNVLADDTFEGRETGSRGGRAAALYVVKQLEKLNIPPGNGKAGYYQPFNSSSNVLALLAGRDPQLSKQFIVVSAHYDHVGYGNWRTSLGPTGFIHNGADDNASGVAGLLEIIKAAVALPERPRRSILFAFWDAEEQGLLGSKYWLEHPSVPLKQVALMANMDMIGRLRQTQLEVHGSRTSRGLRRLVSEQNSGLDLLLNFTWEIKENSDHYSFYRRQIPILMLHTGLHPDYHRPGDDVEKINPEGMREVAQLMFKIIMELAERPDEPRFRAEARQEATRAANFIEPILPPLQPRLGLTFDRQAAPERGVVVLSVAADSAAARGGIRAGDQIQKFNGQEISSLDAFQSAVVSARNPVTVELARTGQAEPVTVELSLTGQPIRVGISWSEDEAEPGSVVLTRVVPASPADRAGLRPRDRIYRIAGRDFTSSQEFAQLLPTLSGEVSIEAETAGRVRTAVLHLPEAEQAGSN